MWKPTLISAAAGAVSLAAIAASFMLAHATSSPDVDGQGTPRDARLRSRTIAPENSRAKTSSGAGSREDPETPTLPAIIEPSECVEIVADVPGRIGRLMVDIGSTVRKGDILAEIIAPGPEFRLAKAGAALCHARARVATARARVKVAEAGVKTARAELEASQAAHRQAEAAAGYRKRQYDRIAELVKEGTLQNRIGEEEQARILADEASEQAGRARVAIMRTALLAADAKLEAAIAAAAEVHEALPLLEIEQEEARLAHESRLVRSPIDGVITRRSHGVGESVRAGTESRPEALFTVVGTGGVRVAAQVADRDAALVTAGAPATFSPDARPGTSYPGTVSRTAAAVDPATRMMRLEIDLDNAGARLLPGQRGTVRIDLRPASRGPSR